MLGGVAAGWLVAGRARPAGDWRRATAIFALAAAAPDLDLLAGTHNTYTHSIGAVAVTVVAAWLLARRRGPRFALACGAAVASHVLLDFLGADTTPPLGIMALWPFTTEYYQSPVPVFMAISRRYWQPHFYAHNTLALLRELAILGPLAVLATRWRTRPRRPEQETPRSAA